MDEDRRTAFRTPEGHLPPDDPDPPFVPNSPDAVDSIAPVAPSPSAPGADVADPRPEVEPARATEPARNDVERARRGPVDSGETPPA